MLGMFYIKVLALVNKYKKFNPSHSNAIALSYDKYTIKCMFKLKKVNTHIEVELYNNKYMYI